MRNLFKQFIENRLSAVGSNSMLNSDADPSVRTKTPSNSRELRRDWYVGDQIVFQLDKEALSYTVSAVKHNQTIIKDFGKIFIPAKNNSEEQRMIFLRKEITLLLKKTKARNPRFGLCLSPETIAVRVFRLPKMPEAELRNAVYYAGQKKTPFPLDDAYWNYRITSESKGDNCSEYLILLIAIAKNTIDDLCNLFSEFGVEFSFIYQDIESLGEALKTLADFSENTGYGIINVRVTRTDMSLYQGSRLQFFHSGSTGSRLLSMPGVQSSQTDNTYPKVLHRFSDSLANEIQNALDYYGAAGQTNDIEKVFVYGDMTFNDELIETLSARFGVPFLTFPPVSGSRILLSDGLLPELLTTALPTIISSASGKRLTDLSPPQLVEKRDTRLFIKVALQSAAMVAVTLGVLWHQSHSFLGNVSETRDTLREQTVTFESSPAYSAYRVLQQEVARQERALESFDDTHTERFLTLKELMALTPAETRVTYFEYYPALTKRQSQLGGVITTTTEAPEVLLAEYVSRLNASPLFTNVSLIRHSKEILEGHRIVTFTLNLEARL